MNILISINDKFIEAATDMLYSLKCNNITDLDIYLIYNDITEENLQKLSDYVNENIGKIHSIYFKSDIQFPINIEHISPETYFRIYAPFILPKEISRILYLDADLIINGNIIDFYNQSFENHTIIGIENCDTKNSVYNENIGLPKENTYINAGVLLINLDKYRKSYTIDEINHYIVENHSILKYQDQDVINYLFYNHIKVENIKYNYQIANMFGSFYNPIIVHYIKANKPWSTTYDNPNKARFLYSVLEKKDPKRAELLKKHHLDNYQKKDILISIIIPAYNMEKYIEKCIISLTIQNIEEIEIICIDDGSTDETSRLLDEYKKKDCRIKVIHQENRGLSAARNSGLEIAKGKYIGFIDSDDYAAPTMYKDLLDYLKQNNLDVVACNFYHVKNDINYLDKEIGINKIWDNKKDILIEILKDKDIKNYVWSKLYKKELWNNVRFPVGKTYEDISVSFPIAEKSNRIGYISKPLYYYNHRENSISKSHNFQKIRDAVYNTYDRYKEIKNKYPELKDYNTLCLIERLAIEYYENKITSKEEFIKEFKEIISMMETEFEFINKEIFMEYDSKEKEMITSFLNEIKKIQS